MSTVDITGEFSDAHPRPDRMLETAYHDHFSSLLAFLKSRRYDDATAHDIAQTAFLRLAEYKKRDQIRDVRAFLFQTVLNLSTDFKRKEATRQRAALDHGEEFAVNGHDVVTPEEDAIFREKVRRLERSIAALPQKRREVVALCLFSDKSRAEIAEQLGMSEPALRMLFMRAVRHCREAMEDVSNKPVNGSVSDDPRSSRMNGFNEHEDR